MGMVKLIHPIITWPMRLIAPLVKKFGQKKKLQPMALRMGNANFIFSKQGYWIGPNGLAI